MVQPLGKDYTRSKNLCIKQFIYIFRDFWHRVRIDMPIIAEKQKTASLMRLTYVTLG